ncbi:hypothetical protein ACBY01_07150 [Sphingomonas sp. ac-8]
MSGFILGAAVIWFVVPQLRRIADAHHDLAAELRRLRELAERGRR